MGFLISILLVHTKRLIMKKSSILFAALFAFALMATSCGGQKETETENTETMESTDDNMEEESMEEETMEADTAAMEMEHSEGDGHDHPSDGGDEHPN